MTWASVLAGSLIFVCAAAGSEEHPVLACNLKAISAAMRPRYNDLIKQVRIALSDRAELPDGYSFKLDNDKVTLPEVAEWITMERLCCPFLTFNLEVSGQGKARLILRGPVAAKAILHEEFPDNRK